MQADGDVVLLGCAFAVSGAPAREGTAIRSSRVLPKLVPLSYSAALRLEFTQPAHDGIAKVRGLSWPAPR